MCLTFLPAPTTVLPSLDVAAHIQTVTTTAPHLEHPPGATTVTATTTPQLGRCCPWPGDLHTGGRGAGGPPCVPSVGGPPRGGVPQPIYYLLFTYTYHVLLPASTATFCFVCSTCDAAMDLLSAHATRLAPEQARLAPTAPRCVATGALGQMAGRPRCRRVSGVVPPAVGSNFGAEGESSTVLGSMPAVAQLLSPADAPGTRTCR